MPVILHKNRSNALPGEQALSRNTGSRYESFIDSWRVKRVSTGMALSDEYRSLDFRNRRASAELLETAFLLSIPEVRHDADCDSHGVFWALDYCGDAAVSARGGGHYPLAAQPDRLHQAADVARAMESPDARGAALARVGRHAADTGQAEVAGRFLAEAAEIAGNIEDSEDRFWARMQIALTQRQAGMAQVADETRRAALAEATTTMRPPDCARLLSVAVQDLFDAELVDEAAAIEIAKGR